MSAVTIPTVQTTATKFRGPASARRWLKMACGIVLVGFFLFPLYWMITASLQNRSALLSGNPPFFPLSPDFSGYAKAWATQSGNLAYSMVVALSAAVIAVILAAPAAFAIVALRLRWVTWVLALVLIVQMLPTVVVANALYTIYSNLGLLNSTVGLVLADVTLGLPFAILTLRAFMATLPSELLEAARVDGASYPRAFVSVILPVSRNGMITVGLFAFLFAWSDFLLALVLKSGGSVTPVTLGIYQYISPQSTDWNAALATALLASLPPAVLLIASQRYISAGLTAGFGK